MSEEPERIERLPSERKWRRPRSVRTYLNRMSDSRGEADLVFTKPQVLEWLSTVAPQAFIKLCERLGSENEDISLKAALAILAYTAGKPAQNLEVKEMGSVRPVVNVYLNNPNG